MDTTKLPREIIESNLFPLATLKASLGAKQTAFFLFLFFKWREHRSNKEGQKGMEITPFISYAVFAAEDQDTFSSCLIFSTMI